jgi:D-alanyl-D-alanine carboxypeptidase/D-alanyl-D-alanine-endopeptidase (penicillin-binding protein 4)
MTRHIRSRSLFGFTLYFCTLLIFAGCTPSSEVADHQLANESEVIIAGKRKRVVVDPKTGAISWKDLFEETEKSGLESGSDIPGPLPYQARSDQSFVPASTTKMITSMALLSMVGAEFRYTTRIQFQVARDNARIATGMKIWAEGDPTWWHSEFSDSTRERLKLLVDELRAHHIDKIRGPIETISSPEWEAVEYAAGVLDTDKTVCYGAVPLAFNVSGNCANLVIVNAGDVHWDDEGPQVRIQNNLRKGSRTNYELQPQWDGDRGIVAYTLSGTWSAKHKRAYESVVVHDTRAWFATKVRRFLEKSGLQFLPNDPQKTSADKPQILDLKSPRLADILRYQNKHSDNFLAQAVFKTLAAKAKVGGKKASLVALSQEIIRRYDADWLKSGGHAEWSRDLQFLDGAGLSFDNRATPRAFMALLQAFQEHPQFGAFVSTLSVAGKDGTLRNRFDKTVAEGRIWAKTGTLKGFYQLAGYILLKGHRGDGARDFVPFVLLTHTTPENRWRVYDFQEHVGVEMVRLLDRPNGK